MIPTETFDRHVSDGHLTEYAKATVFGKIVHGLNGDLLTLVELKTQQWSKFYRDVLICSHDEGKTWTRRSVVAAVESEDNPAPWIGEEGPNEGALVRLADGRLLTVFRTGAVGQGTETWGRHGRPTTAELDAAHCLTLSRGCASNKTFEQRSVGADNRAA